MSSSQDIGGEFPGMEKRCLNFILHASRCSCDPLDKEVSSAAENVPAPLEKKSVSITCIQ